MDNLVRELILQALRENPNGLTEKQIKKYVEKKLKKIAKIIDLFQEI